MQNERDSAFAWLMEDPEHRSIESPTFTDAVLNLYAAREAYPDAVFTTDQFTSERQPAPPDRETLALGLHLFVF